MKYQRGQVCTYTGTTHPGLTGWTVVVVGVIRDGGLVEDAAQVGELQEGDLLEVRPIIEGRLSFVSYDAAARELEATGASWPGKSKGPLLGLGRQEGDAMDHERACLEDETALFHAHRIARTELCIETLETRNSDRLDFHPGLFMSKPAASLHT